MSETATAYNPAVHNLRHVSPIRLFLRALGVSFFSLVSVAIAFYAFIELPQVQDLFFDARPYVFQGIVYWAGFYLIGIFIWALPLVFTARLLLLQNFDLIGVDSEERFNFYIFRLPSYYVVAAYTSLFFGIIAAAANLPAPSADGGNAAEVPLRTYLEHHLITLFIASGAVLILVIIRDLFIKGYGNEMQKLEQRDPAKFKSTLVRFETIARKHTQDLDGMDIYLTALKPAFLSEQTWISAQRVKVFMWRYLTAVTWVLLALVAIHFMSYSDTVARFFTIPDLSSYPKLADAYRIVSDTLWLKRASFLFVVFGAWLPFFMMLALLSNRHQFPYITSLIIAGTGLTLFFSDGHDARVLTIAPPDQSKLHPVSFKDAVQNWKAASGWDARGCEKLAPGAAELAACPRPIIVSGEGGGSRAAFLLASVLGSLEDDSLQQARGNASAKPFHQQLFAISSVSGSSVGAAFFMSALKRQPAVPLETLKSALYNQRLWFLNVATAGTPGEKFLNDVVTYKDALQATLSNDFLSPVMIAYLARDVLTLSRLPYIMDRAGVLETSWEDAFNGVYGTTRDSSPLAAPLQTISPSATEWTPLLFLNTTSIETGRRVIATPVKMTELLPDSNALFIDAYDMHELFCSSKDPSKLQWLDRIARFLPAMFSPVTNATCVNSKPTSIDVRLSTAAGMSSRSAFVSPHANIRDTTGQITDSVVDGGYFDNSGAVTGLEIAASLKVVDPRLNPYMIQVSSEPDWFKNTTSCGQQTTISSSARPEIPDESDFKPLGTLGNILTVNATRVARGYETILELPRQMKQLNAGLLSDSAIYICPQRKENFFLDQFIKLTTADEAQKQAKREVNIREKTQSQSAVGWKSVSLSWWLSPPLQAYLDGQIYAQHNKKSRDCVLSLLKDRTAQDRATCG